jgi:YfiH family protein
MRLVSGSSGATVLRSAPLDGVGVPHAFATRKGGVSGRQFESLNFGNPGELGGAERDPAGNIAENFRRLLAAAGCAGRELVEVHQVHGAGVLVFRDSRSTDFAEPKSVAREWVKADAIVTDDARLALAVRVADCAPVLIASRDGGVVAAVHAGWRGTVMGVVPAAIEEMRKLGAADLVAAVGPCIGVDAFEVGPEVAGEFERVLGDAGTGGRPPRRTQAASGTEKPGPGSAGADSLIRRGQGDRWHVDLAGAIAAQLAAAGVAEVDLSGRCTVSEPEWFFSHRRDGVRSGRMAAVIGCRSS